MYKCQNALFYQVFTKMNNMLGTVNGNFPNSSLNFSPSNYIFVCIQNDECNLSKVSLLHALKSEIMLLLR